MVTTTKASTTTSLVQASGGGKRAGRQQHSGDKINKQSTTITGPANSYAGVLKSSPIQYDQLNTAPCAGKPVAYVRPNVPDSVTVSEADATSTGQFPTADVGRDVLAPVTSDHPVMNDRRVPDVTFVSTAAVVMTTTAAVTVATTVKPFTFVASPVRNVTNSSSSSAVTMTTSSVKRSPVREDSNRDGLEVATKRIRLGPSSTAMEFATKLNISAMPFVPSTRPSIIAPSTQAVPSAIPSAVQPIVATPPVSSPLSATQSMITRSVAFAPLVPAQPIVATPSVAAATPSLVPTQSIVAAPPSVVPAKSKVAMPSVSVDKSAVMIAPSSVTTPNLATATPPHKHPALIAGYQWPSGPIVPAPTILPVFVPPSHMAATPGGYALTQPGPYPFPAVPSHVYPVDAAHQPHPHSIMGLAYSGGIQMQPHPQAAANNAYRLLVPTAAPPTGTILQQPAQQIDYHKQQRKKDQEPKRYPDQNIVPQFYKFPTAPLPVKVPSSEGRRTLLESPAIAPAPLPPPLPLDNTTLTGSKRKRRGPLMPLPQQQPTAASRNVTMTTLW